MESIAFVDPQRSGERELHPGKFIQVHAVEAMAWDN
jgi:hypothetical protein